MLRLVLLDESPVDLDLTQLYPDRRGEYLDNETDGLLVVNAVADALKLYHQIHGV